MFKQARIPGYEEPANELKRMDKEEAIEQYRRRFAARTGELDCHSGMSMEEPEGGGMSISETTPPSSIAQGWQATAADLRTYYLEDEERDICAINEPPSTPIEIIWDTECGNHVADKADLPEYSVEPSAGSRRGQTFTDASGGTLENEGQSSQGEL